MMNVFTCSCGKVLLVKEDCAASQGLCPGCGQMIDLLPIKSPGTNDRAFAGETESLPDDSAWQEIGPLPNRPARDSVAPKRYRPLYSPGAVAAASLLGGWLIGCLLLAENYRQLHRRRAARLTAFLGLAGTGLIMVLVLSAVHVPPGWKAVPVLVSLYGGQMLVSSCLLYVASRVLQGRLFAEHLQRGGKGGSIGSLVPLGMFVAALTFFLQAILTYPATWDGTGGSLVFGSEERLFYTEGVSVHEAGRLGTKLQEYRLFDGNGIKTVIVLNSETGITIRLFMELAEPDPRSAELLWQDAQRVGDRDRDYYQVLCRQISRDIFPGQPVEILLYDLSGVPQRSARAIAD